VRVAIFGGSFNPPHVSHVLAVALVLATEDVDRVLVVPTFRHPFSKRAHLVAFDDRVRMAELAMGWLPRVVVSRIEEELGGESRTLFTLERLQQQHPEWKMRHVIGADLLLEAPKWHAFDRVAAIAPPLVLGRVGVAAPPGSPAPLLPEVSSTDVRSKLRAGRYDDVARFVPREVLAYVREKRLYAGGGADGEAAT